MMFRQVAGVQVQAYATSLLCGYMPCACSIGFTCRVCGGQRVCNWEGAHGSVRARTVHGCWVQLGRGVNA